jgi:hypothetical protein
MCRDDPAIHVRNTTNIDHKFNASAYVAAISGLLVPVASTQFDSPLQMMASQPGERVLRLF